MPEEALARLESEIERLRRRYSATLRESPGARPVTARWVAEVSGLCWFVPLEDVVEADIDVEIMGEALVVRAGRSWPAPALLMGILPVPYGFDPAHVVIRFVEQTLQIRIRWLPGGLAP